VKPSMLRLFSAFVIGLGLTAFALSILLAADGLPVLDCMVQADSVVRHLLSKSPSQIEPPRASKVEDPNQAIGKLNFEHLPVGQLVVWQVLPVSLHRFGKLRNAEHQEFSGVTLLRLPGFDVGPPFRVRFVANLREFVEYTIRSKFAHAPLSPLGRTPSRSSTHSTEKSHNIKTEKS
jgi:hypothetical protein